MEFIDTLSLPAGKSGLSPEGLPPPDFAPVQFAVNEQTRPYADAVSRLEDYLAAGRQNPAQRVLYNTQLPVMENVHQFLARYGPDLRGRAELPTGSGKTTIYSELVKATGLRTLIVTYTKDLVDAAAAEFKKFGDQAAEVSKVYTHEKDETKQVTVTTYSSLERHAQDPNSPYLRPENYQLVILDEMQHATAPGASQTLRLFSHAAQIGLSAEGGEELSALFPHEIHRMTVREAVLSRLVSPFWVWVVETETDLSGVRVDSFGQYNRQDLQRAVNTAARNQTTLELYKRHFLGMHTLASCSGIEHAEDVAATFRDDGISSMALHSKMGRTNYRRWLEAAKDRDSDLRVVTNDQILAEGFDAPFYEVALNLEPTGSRIKANQRPGRAMRNDQENPDKIAHIVEFIDRNSRRPPYIYPDQDIAGTAYMGRERTFPPTKVFHFDLASARVIYDPVEVEELARGFHNDRTFVAPRAPKGWLTEGLLVASFEGIPAALGKKAFEAARQSMPREVWKEYSGMFALRGNRRNEAHYYSPELREAMIPFLEYRETAPEDRLGAAQVTARYGQKDASATRQALRERAAELQAAGMPASELSGEYRDELTGRLTEYFAPEVVEAFATRKNLKFLGDQVPPVWVDDEALAQECGPNASQAALATIFARSKAFTRNHSMSRDGATFYSATMQQRVRDLVKPPRGGVDVRMIARLRNIEAAEAQALIDSLAEHRPGIHAKFGRLCWVDGQEVPYFEREVLRHLDGEAKRQRAAPVDWEPGKPIKLTPRP